MLIHIDWTICEYKTMEFSQDNDVVCIRIFNLLIVIEGEIECRSHATIGLLHLDQAAYDESDCSEVFTVLSRKPALVQIAKARRKERLQEE